MLNKRRKVSVKIYIKKSNSKNNAIDIILRGLQGG